MALLSRTYLQKTTGSPQFAYFDYKSGYFVASFLLDTSFTSATELYLNEDLHYTNGFNVVVSPSGSLSWRKIQKNKIEFTATPLAKNGERIEIIIYRS